MAALSKSMLANPLYDIDEEWAVELVGLRMKVQGYWWTWNASDEEKRAFYGGIIKRYDDNKRKWLIQFDNGDDDAFMRYDSVLKYADEDAITFSEFNLQNRMKASEGRIRKKMIAVHGNIDRKKRPRREKDTAEEVAKETTLYVVWRVNVTEERHDNIFENNLLSIHTTAQNAKNALKNFNKTIVMDGGHWDEEHEMYALYAIEEGCNVFTHGTWEPESVTSNTTVGSKDTVWAVMKTEEHTTGDEGLAWLGTGQYDYDTKDVSLCSLFVTEQEANACIEEFENNGDDDDDDEDDDDDDDVDDDDGNDDDEENCIADSTYYHSEEFILDAEE